MDVMAIIRKIKKAQENYRESVRDVDNEVYWDKYNEADSILDEVIRELEQQIDDGK